MPRDDFDNWRMYARNSTNMWPKSARLKEFPQADHPAGAGSGLSARREDWIRRLAARHPWDYFIGSVHYVSDSWEIDDPQKTVGVEAS